MQNLKKKNLRVALSLLIFGALTHAEPSSWVPIDGGAPIPSDSFLWHCSPRHYAPSILKNGLLDGGTGIHFTLDKPLPNIYGDFVLRVRPGVLADGGFPLEYGLAPEINSVKNRLPSSVFDEVYYYDDATQNLRRLTPSEMADLAQQGPDLPNRAKAGTWKGKCAKPTAVKSKLPTRCGCDFPDGGRPFGGMTAGSTAALGVELYSTASEFERFIIGNSGLSEGEQELAHSMSPTGQIRGAIDDYMGPELDAISKAWEAKKAENTKRYLDALDAEAKARREARARMEKMECELAKERRPNYGRGAANAISSGLIHVPGF